MVLSKNCDIIPVYSSTNRKKKFKSVRQFSINSTSKRKSKQIADTLAGFENSPNGSQKLDEHPGIEFLK